MRIPRNSAQFGAILRNDSDATPSSSGLSDRIGSTGNQFALTTLLGTACLLPFFLGLEASRFGQFVELFKTVRRRRRAIPSARNSARKFGASLSEARAIHPRIRCRRCATTC